MKMACLNLGESFRAKSFDDFTLCKNFDLNMEKRQYLGEIKRV